MANAAEKILYMVAVVFVASSPGLGVALVTGGIVPLAIAAAIVALIGLALGAWYALDTRNTTTAPTPHEAATELQAILHDVDGITQASKQALADAVSAIHEDHADAMNAAAGDVLAKAQKIADDIRTRKLSG